MSEWHSFLQARLDDEHADMSHVQQWEALKEAVSSLGRTLWFTSSPSTGNGTNNLPAALPLSQLVQLLEAGTACESEWPALIPGYNYGASRGLLRPYCARFRVLCA